MELIYRSTIMKKLTKILCVMLIVFSVFQLAGCDKLSSLGKTKTKRTTESIKGEVIYHVKEIACKIISHF